jgi:ABC-type lipoprotein release transport system permease subunit
MSVAKKVFIEVGIGLFTGAAITPFLMRGIRHFLESSPSAGVSTYLISISMIPLVSAAAVFFPARRAVMVNPTQALRNE